MNETLQQLSELSGVSGDEKIVRQHIRDLIADHIDEWRVDTMGNLFAIKKGTGESDLRVMVDAHMDEVGLMITSIEADGSFGFRPVGGFDTRSLLGKVVSIGPKEIIGVIGVRLVHLSSAVQRDTVPKLEQLRIDIGLSKKDQVAGKVKIGDRATFVTKYEETGTHAIGKALDNRAGCTALIELIKGDPYPFDLHAVFTVQEEVGLRGAMVASYDFDPEVALILECTPAYDMPNKRDDSPNVALGLGPSIYTMDSQAIHDPRFVAHILRTAEANGLPYQLRKPGGGGTNAGVYQRMRGGTAVATIATPGRYLHTPASMINLTDFANVIKLADATLRGLKRELFAR